MRCPNVRRKRICSTALRLDQPRGLKGPFAIEIFGYPQDLAVAAGEVRRDLTLLREPLKAAYSDRTIAALLGEAAGRTGASGSDATGAIAGVYG